MLNGNLREVRCNLCGSDKYKILGKKNSYQIVSCACGLVYVNPQPSEELIKNSYNEQYFKDDYNLGKGSSKYLENEDVSKWLLLDLLEKIAPKKGKLLDIGCAVGYLLKAAEERGWQIDGVEISEFARRLAEQRLNKKIFTSLKDPEIKVDSYEAVTASEVIEHVSDPASFLKSIYPCLKENGILIVTTPNLKNAEIYQTILDWECIIPPTHLYHFNKQTITKMLEQNGFKVISITYGPMNIFKGKINEQVSNWKRIYYKVKPLIEPVKKILLDAPISWYGKRAGIGETLIVVAKKLENY